MRYHTLGALLCSVIFGFVSIASGGTVTASTYAGGGTLGNFDSVTGWFFTPTVPIVVDELGVYDHGAPGFASPHEIGIFMTNGTAMVTATIGAGTSGTLIDGTRFVNVPATSLSAGTRYYIVANNFMIDQFVYGSGAVHYAPQITWNGFGDGSSNSIFSPVTNLGGLPGNLGPNFRFVPEPACLSGLLLCGVALLRRR